MDRRNYHLFQPVLYQVATGSPSAGEIASIRTGQKPVGIRFFRPVLLSSGRSIFKAKSPSKKVTVALARYSLLGHHVEHERYGCLWSNHGPRIGATIYYAFERRPRCAFSFSYELIGFFRGANAG